MRRAAFLSLVVVGFLGGAGMAQAQTPPPIKPGLWQVRLARRARNLQDGLQQPERQHLEVAHELP
jgi:hypothetical protein